MAIKQLTDSEYQQLSASALKAAGVDGSAYTDAEIARAVGECKRVHRLLAVDGQKAEDLTPGEQVYAAAFRDVRLATVEEVDSNVRTGNLLPAVEVPEPAAEDAAPKPKEAKTNGKK